MKWWLRAHAALLCAVSLMVTLLLAPVLAGSTLPIPSLFGGLSTGIPVPLVLPVIPAAVVLHAMSRVPGTYETTAVRPVLRYQAGLPLAACAIALVVTVVEAHAADLPLALAVARNLMGYLGVGLVVHSFAGPQYGPLSVAVVPVFCAVVGLGPSGRPFTWAWPVHEASSPLAAACAGSLFGLGLLAYLSVPTSGMRRDSP